MTDRDDYLWDRSGTPDPEVVALEEALSELRFERPMPAIPKKRPTRAGWWLAAAAVVALALGFGLWPSAQKPLAAGLPAPSVAVPRAVGEGWKVARLSGTPTCSGEPIGSKGELGVGEWLVTDDASRARLDVADIGKLEVAPSTRLRLVQTGREQHRLELERGRIHAKVDAPPRLFVVDTPSASAVDLGCEYTLAVTEDGGSILEVTLGWVALEAEKMTAWVPEGAKCKTHPGGKVGIPYASDASSAFLAALERFEKDASVDELLKVSRAADRVSLWHALWRSDARQRIYQRMLAQGATPAADRAGVLRGDAPALLAWGRSLGLAPPNGPDVWR